MLYKFLVASMICAASAFSGPVSVVQASTAGRTAAVSMDGSWRRSYDGRGSGVGGASAPAAAAAPAGASTDGSKASVTGVMSFMVANPSISFAEKKAFLLDMGVSEILIAQSACVAPDTDLVL